MRKWPCSRQQGVWLLILLLVAATLVWILNSTNIIQGNWATVLNATFTGLGTIFALLQWHTQAISDSPGPIGLSTYDQAGLHDSLIQNGASRRKGAIVVYTPRNWRGTTLNLIAGLQEKIGPDTPLEAISTVVEHVNAKQRMFQCFFPAVPPGHYTLVAPSKQRQAQVTVRSGHLSEIDWR